MEKQLSLLERYLNELPDKASGAGRPHGAGAHPVCDRQQTDCDDPAFFRRAMERSSASEEAAQFLDSSIKFVSYTILVFMILQLFLVWRQQALRR